jgi:hypothetical protein
MRCKFIFRYNISKYIAIVFYGCTFPVDQLTLVVSIIPIWISPEFLNIYGRKLLDYHSVWLGAGPESTLPN